MLGLFYRASPSSLSHSCRPPCWEGVGTHSKSLTVPHTRPAPCCQIGFHTIPGPLPATRAMQLSPVSSGMHTGLLWLRIELWRVSAAKRERERGTESAAVRAVKRKSISATCKSGAQLCVFGADRPLLFRGVSAQRPPGSLCVGKTSFCGPFLFVFFLRICSLVALLNFYVPLWNCSMFLWWYLACSICVQPWKKQHWKHLYM